MLFLCYSIIYILFNNNMLFWSYSGGGVGVDLVDCFLFFLGNCRKLSKARVPNGCDRLHSAYAMYFTLMSSRGLLGFSHNSTLDSFIWKSVTVWRRIIYKIKNYFTNHNYYEPTYIALIWAIVIYKSKYEMSINKHPAVLFCWVFLFYWNN